MKLYDVSPKDGSDFYLQYDKHGKPYDLCRECGKLTAREKLTGSIDDWVCPKCLNGGKKMKALNYVRVKNIILADCQRKVVSSISGAGVRIASLSKDQGIWYAFIEYYEGAEVTDSYDWEFDTKELRQIEKELIARGDLK